MEILKKDRVKRKDHLNEFGGIFLDFKMCNLVKNSLYLESNNLGIKCRKPSKSFRDSMFIENADYIHYYWENFFENGNWINYNYSYYFNLKWQSECEKEWLNRECSYIKNNNFLYYDDIFSAFESTRKNYNELYYHMKLIEQIRKKRK